MPHTKSSGPRAQQHHRASTTQAGCFAHLGAAAAAPPLAALPWGGPCPSAAPSAAPSSLAEVLACRAAVLQQERKEAVIGGRGSPGAPSAWQTGPTQRPRLPPYRHSKAAAAPSRREAALLQAAYCGRLQALRLLGVSRSAMHRVQGRMAARSSPPQAQQAHRIACLARIAGPCRLLCSCTALGAPAALRLPAASVISPFRRWPTPGTLR